MSDSLQDWFRLDGQVALVTGGGRGLGMAIARAYAGAGAAVCLVSRSQEQLQAAAALYLVSPAAAFTTGASLVVDGGYLAQ